MLWPFNKFIINSNRTLNGKFPLRRKYKKTPAEKISDAVVGSLVNASGAEN